MTHGTRGVAGMLGVLLAVGVAIALAAGCGTAEETAPPTASPQAGTPRAARTAPAVETATAGTPVATAPATRTPVPTPAATEPAEPVASTAGIPIEELPRVEFVRRDGTEIALPVEVPPRDEYGIGLSGRRELEGRGMLFYYPDPRRNAGFWMKNTHIDLSIAFVDTRGRIIAIREMTAESEEVVRPDGPYEMAIEAPAGWYEEHEVREGDLVRLDFEIPDHLRS